MKHSRRTKLKTATKRKVKPRPRPEPPFVHYEEVRSLIPAHPGFEELVYLEDEDTILRYPVIAWQEEDYLSLQPVILTGLLDERVEEAPKWCWGLQRPDGWVQDNETGTLFDNVHSWINHVREAIRLHAAERVKEAA